MTARPSACSTRRCGRTTTLPTTPTCRPEELRAARRGPTTAAWFIRRFAYEDIPWVHLDIASVAFRDRELGPDPKGATGYGVRTLVALARRLESK
ncbi:MAG: hypothetical protein IPI39_25575 [Candidatus Obscuribacter sp.]|nr:hypothetical protein [Candidatus Obscuribacter sp.]